MKKFKYSLLITLVGVSLFFTQAPGGGGGPVTPGAPSSSIDNYIILLAIIAFLLITFGFKKLKKAI